MSNMIVKIWTGIILFLLLLNPVKLISQNQPSELEIKRSDSYYWGQSYNVDPNQARLDARDDLMSKISNQISKSSTLNGKSDILVQYIQYINKPVDELTKVVAFVSIKDVNNIKDNKQPLQVSEIKYTEANSTINDETPVEKTANPNESKPIEEQTTPIVTTIAPTQTITLAPTITPAPTIENSLLGRLIACNTGNELRMLFAKEEEKNTLIFNWNSESYRKTVSSNNFYIVLINPNNDKIDAFLDKGQADRPDLKNEKRIVKTSEYQNMIQVWIQLL